MIDRVFIQQFWRFILRMWLQVDGLEGNWFVGAIKDFIRCLSPNIIPSELWDEVVRIGKMGNTMDLEKAWNLLMGLPRSNYMTLMFILTMIYKFAEVESNGMKIPAFVICISPNFINREYFLQMIVDV